MSDQTLSDPTPADSGDTVFGNPNGHQPAEKPPVRMFTLEDVLSFARLPEKHARICLKANLQARHDDIVAELATLIDIHGELIEDDTERSVGDVSARDRVTALSQELSGVQREMAGSMWFPLFRGMSADDLAVFNKQHLPKTDKPTPEAISEYNQRLVAECAIEPELTVEDVKKLRKKLGSRAIAELISVATEVCTRGGVDVPKSPASLLNLAQQ